jgi:dimethylamine/trimethylamine dehydrogenase
MGEEWRKGWHPERMRPKASEARVLIVGAGPAGLEAARAAGLRGYQVMLAEAKRILGGRVAREATLPGMSEYIRVRDYREQQLLKLPNVEIFRESRLTAQDIFDIAPDHVAIATGADWRRDRFDGKTYVPVAPEGVAVHTPDDIMEGRLPEGPVVLFDGDNYYLAGVLAERLRAAGLEVTYITESDSVSDWAGNTSERWRIRTRLMEAGVAIVTGHALTGFDGQRARLTCEYTGASRQITAKGAVLVTQRAQRDGLYHEILNRVGGEADRLPFTLRRIGDCEAPAIIAAAVYAGHRYAAELGVAVDPDDPLRHDRPVVGAVLPTSPAASRHFTRS